MTKRTIMTKRNAVLATCCAALLIFAVGAFVYTRQAEPQADPEQPTVAAVQDDQLVRSHSPVIGPQTAPVTIVEFFDPSCEACRAMYPYVKQIMAAFPEDVRLVLRYTPFHQGSDEAVKIIEAARLQNKFETVLEALLARQPEWAMHGAPDLGKAWEFAGAAGLDVERARRDLTTSNADAVLKQDMADSRSNRVLNTPTFYVNGKPLTDFGPQQLYDLVSQEVQAHKSKAGS
jgi:protein-disulfide isomerase